MRNKIILLLLILFPQLEEAQVLDRVYVKEIPPSRSIVHPPDPENPSFEIPELRHPDSVLLNTMRYYENNYSKPALSLKGCTYFYPNQKGNMYRIEPKPWNDERISDTKDTSSIKKENNPDKRANYKPNDAKTKKYPFFLPSCFRFYADTSFKETFQHEEGKYPDIFFYTFLCRKAFSEMYRPFYFKNTEVSNGEYKEFTDWVRDSIARTLLLDCDFKAFGSNTDKTSGKVLLNWKTKLNWSDSAYKECLAPLFKSASERFYSRNEIDARKLNYAYTPFAYEKRKTKEIINVYPDTLTWINDFTYSFNEPMANMYFWHPAYAGYPVVGVTRNQCEAFIHWKTEREQKELDKQGKNLKIEYDLPSEYQWEMVATSQKSKQGPTVFNKGYALFSDRNFLTDLRLKGPDTISQHIIRKDATEKNVTLLVERQQNQLVQELQRSVVAVGDFTVDGIFHTAPVDYDIAIKGLKYRMHGKSEWGRKIPFRDPQNISANAMDLFKINRDENGICYMGGNVSEWMKESYKENWLPMYTRRHELMKKLKGKDIEIALALEDYYNSKCDTNGVLVRGSNWFDERYNNRYGKNTAGMSAKTFVSPDEAHCTVGFRYIVRVMKKDEPLQTW